MCEEEEVKTHPDKGIQILEPVHFLRPILATIRHHHERFDGSGYPLGLKGKEIPFKARIISIADVGRPCFQTGLTEKRCQ